MSYYTKNKTSEFIAQLSRLQFMCGLTYVWVDNNKSRFFVYFNKVATILLYSFILSEIASLFTQTHLSEKQASDQILFVISHPVLMSYSLSCVYYGEDIKKLLFKLSVDLKGRYNDLEIENEMIRKAKLYSVLYVMTLSAALFFYAFDAVSQVIRTDGTFTTIIMAWPDVKEKGFLPDVVRVGAYLIWWIFMIRASAVYVFVITLTIVLSHQYKNLQSYFYNLEEVFITNNENRDEKEKEYESGLKIGIALHAETMWCVKECQRICSWVFSGQITINITVFCMLMLQMVNSERTLVNALATLSTSLSLLVSTGFFMCNAGDVTVEASILPTAIFFSGWHHCRGKSSIRVRKLITFAIAQSQKPITMRSFNVIELSYRSYVSIVKSSYSVFSILY
ncbi:unnamed protein product [Pieris macdunnoughi]|uniref:Odorant receptor n=1 Tax=Pieris macdunnoughi TaxID=345717 RepID=A0A821Q6S5_9NEOP|nr:unnamed protein product [Pieris macdunnoughi]